jgi:AcrR family transcriptional regulator
MMKEKTYDSKNYVWAVDCPTEYKMDMSPLKWAIFCCAVFLFAETDYSAVSIRQIANELGIALSTIYLHFKSKNEILNTMFDYHRKYGLPQNWSVEHFLQRAETDPPRELLMSIHAFYPPSIQSIMSKIILISHKMMRAERRAAEIITHDIIEVPKRYYLSVLNRLVELGRVEPLDTEAFVELILNTLYGAAMRMYSDRPVDGELWVRASKELFARLQVIR